jgi:hypothetical protein
MGKFLPERAHEPLLCLIGAGPRKQGGGGRQYEMICHCWLGGPNWYDRGFKIKKPYISSPFGWGLDGGS